MVLDEKNYNINKVYASGFSGCGETMSLVMGKSDEYYGSTPIGGSLVAHDFKIMNWLLTR